MMRKPIVEDEPTEENEILEDDKAVTFSENFSKELTL